MKNSKRIVVVGGGITGLSAAYRLQQLAPEAEVTVLEASDRAGGKILTERVDGFTIEAGPDSFLTSKPEALALGREIGLGDHLEGVNPATRKTFIMRNGRLVDLPQGLSGLVPARLGPLFRSPLLTPVGKLRVALEPVIRAPGGDEDESLGSFMRRRFGNEAYERLIEGLMTGIYGGNGDSLSLQATFPRLRDMERNDGSLIRGLRRARSGAGTTSSPPSPFVAPLGGMGEIVDALLRRMQGVHVRTECSVTGLRSDAGEYVVAVGGQELPAAAVILSTPAYVTADLVDPIDGGVAEILRRIPYASSATISLGYNRAVLGKTPAGHGYIIPAREGRAVMACTCTSNKFDHRAPPGSTLFRVFVGRVADAHWQRWSDEHLADLAREELRSTLGIEDAPDVVRVFRWPRAMPQYVVGHLFLLARARERLEAQPGLFLAGAAYEGVGIPDCIRSGETAARAAARFVASAGALTA
jgi:oxygen-dependent protoporphyrinogen oxidase